MFRFLYIATIIACICLIAYTMHSKNSLIPLEDLFGNPDQYQLRISPDKTKLSYLKSVNNVLNVWIKTIGKNDDHPITKDTNRGIRSHHWSQDHKHIFYLQDYNGDENWHLYMTNIFTKETTNLTPYKDVQVRFNKHNKFHPEIICFEMNKDNPENHDIYSINIITKELTLLDKNPGNFNQWILTSDLEPKAAISLDDQAGSTLHLKKDGEWKSILHWSSEETENSSASHFTRDNKFLYITSSIDNNTAQLIKINVETLEQTVIANNKKYEVEDIFTNPNSLEVEAVAFYGSRLEWNILPNNQNLAIDFNIIKKLHHGDFNIGSKSNDNKLWVVSFNQDVGPIPYYIYNRDTKTAQFIFYHKKRLVNYQFQPMNPIEFTSRDGLNIEGYMTYPKNYQSKKSPMVLLVHGGPWSRDKWGYNSEVQWFANRGYACLQVNFRGSTGYGNDFLNAGNKQWSLKMHDDLIDAVKWAIKTGYIDSEKIAIYGGSYGGYAALVGATFTPDVFCCAVDIVGPSNLITLLQSFPPYWKKYIYSFHKMVGNPETEYDFLKECSPLFKVDAIKIPLLIAQGAHDPRVKQAESEQIVEKLKEKNIPHTYLLFDDEGHGFAKPKNKLKFYNQAESFLNKHLGQK